MWHSFALHTKQEIHQRGESVIDVIGAPVFVLTLHIGLGIRKVGGIIICKAQLIVDLSIGVSDNMMENCWGEETRGRGGRFKRVKIPSHTMSF